MSVDNPECYKYDIYLNGQLVKSVIVADDEEGTVLFDSTELDNYRQICPNVEVHQSGLFGMAKGNVEIRLLDTKIRILEHGANEQLGSGSAVVRCIHQREESVDVSVRE